MSEFVKKSLDEQKNMSVEELHAYREEERKHFFGELEAKMQGELKDLEKKFDSLKPEEQEKAVEELEKKYNSSLEKIEKELGAIKAEVAKSIEGASDGSFKSIEEVLTGAKKAEFQEFLANKTGKFTFELALDENEAKAMDITNKATQAASDINTGTDFATMLPGVGQIPRNKRYMKDVFRIQNVNTEYIKYIDQNSVVRDAKNVAGCGDTTHTTKLTWRTRTVQIQKVRDFVDVCIDMLEDYSFVEGEIRNLIDSSLELKIDTQLLSGDNVAPNLDSVDNVASTFSASASGANYAGTVEAAQLIDLIVVCAAQISAFGSENAWMADTVLLNPRDFTLLKLIKDQNDAYIAANTIWNRLTPSPNGGGAMMLDNQIELIPNPNVTANELYVFDSTKGVILMRKGAVIEFSYENNDNFETETVTIKAYERLNFHVRNVDANAFMHVSSINAALAALETT